MSINDNQNIKGIILAGGAGTRLYPLTKITSKQLLPVYNKPMIFYPLSVLIDTGIKDVMIITTKEDQENFKKLLGYGDEWGINIDYIIQKKPEGIAQSLIICEDWINDSSVALILGDNLFFGPDFNELIIDAIYKNQGATIFCIESNTPERFGVLEFDEKSNILSIEEKPEEPKSNLIVTGLYIYDNNASSLADTLKKSTRGEYEITDLNMIYLNNNKLNVKKLDSNYSWLDTGTFDTLLEASNYVKNLEKK
ncbi:MAG: glucose-1-phosphate thymidylyltransferase [Rhodobiaceae bacterium]|nr:glucose-1-phosphate thymidylyltransferase [Rhodobiaceae bacterium]